MPLFQKRAGQSIRSRKPGGAIPKGHPTGSGKNTNVIPEKKSENPADSFLKEARRIIPNARGRRNSNRQNQIRPGPQPSKQNTHQTKIAPTENPYTVPLDNMFAPLESQEGATARTPPRRGSGNPRRQNEIPPFLPDDFPPIREDAQANPRQHPNRFTSSTPVPPVSAMDQTWADIDNDDSKAIEAFLANSADIQPETPTQPPNIAMGGALAPSPDQNIASNQVGGIELDRVNSAGPGMAQRTGIQENVRNKNSNHPSQQYNPSKDTNARPDQQGRGGARPKSANVPFSSQGPRSPRKVVTRNGWFTTQAPDNKKRKRTRSSNIACPSICGPNTKPYRDIFVRGLRTDIYEGPEQMQDSIQDYCEERGVALYYIRILSNTEDGLANIKIQVAACDFQTVLDQTFWPENVSVREWFNKPPNSQNSE